MIMLRMHLKLLKTQNQVDFPDFNKTNLSGWREFFFGFLSRQQRQRQRHTQAATEAFEATAGRYRCGERQQGKSVPAAGLGIPPNNGGGCFLGEFAPQKTPPQTSFRLRNCSTLGGQLWWQKKTPAVVFLKKQPVEHNFLHWLVVCFFLSFFLSFFVYLSFFWISFVCSWGSIMSLPIPVVFFSSNFPVQEDLCHRKAHRRNGTFLQTTSFKWMEQKSWVERV